MYTVPKLHAAGDTK